MCEVVAFFTSQMSAEVIKAEFSFYPFHDSLDVAGELFLFLD